jgi:tetratricopeptide (TPR) repeat protein
MPKKFAGASSSHPIPDALSLFTDRLNEQRYLEEILQYPCDKAKKNYFLTNLYGVGGVGKSTLLQKAYATAAQTLKPRVVLVSLSFDDSRWRPSTPFAEVVGEICRALILSGIVPQFTLLLLAIYSERTGRHDSTGRSLEETYNTAFTALEKGIELTGIPGIGLLAKGAQWLYGAADRDRLRKKMVEKDLWPKEKDGRTYIQDLEKKMAGALYQDIREWLNTHQGKCLRFMIDGFERIQSTDRKEDSQSYLQLFLGYFCQDEEPEIQTRFRVIIFGRNLIRWDELYEDPEWREYWTQHILEGLAEADAREFLGKIIKWCGESNQESLKKEIHESLERILDAADEQKGGKRVFYPFYLNLAAGLLQRAWSNGEKIDLGKAPGELQDRFFRYLEEKELRALMVLALAEVFDEKLYDWLATERIIEYPKHSFHTQVRKSQSFFIEVEPRSGFWKFHRLMEDALQAKWLTDESKRKEGIALTHQMLGYFGKHINVKSIKDWLVDDIEAWKKGVETIVTQGPELGLLPATVWTDLLTEPPWDSEHPKCWQHRLAFFRRATKERPDMTKDQKTGIEVMHFHLGKSLEEAGELQEAFVSYQRFYNFCLNKVGEKSKDTLAAMNQMASVCMDMGQLDQSEDLYLKALKISQEMYGEGASETLGYLNNLGILYAERKDPEKAEEFYQKTLEACQKHLGNDHLQTLCTWNNLANLLHERKKYQEAVSIHSRVLDVRIREQGKDHPMTASSYENLGHSLRALAQKEEALEMYRNALSSYEAIEWPKQADVQELKRLIEELET